MVERAGACSSNQEPLSFLSSLQKMGKDGNGGCGLKLGGWGFKLIVTGFKSYKYLVTLLYFWEAFKNKH